MVLSIIADGLDRAGGEGFFTQLALFFPCGLLEDV